MALSTQCPHCKATFRVAQDQLKLRAGLVRCGNCKEIFNGIENLLRPDGSTVATALSGNTVTKSSGAASEPAFQAPAVSRPAPVAAPAPVIVTQAESPSAPDTPAGITDFFDLIKKPTVPAPVPQSEKPLLTITSTQPDPLIPVIAMTRTEDTRTSEAGRAQASTASPEVELEKPAASSRRAAENPELPDPLDAAVEDLQRISLSGAEELTDQVAPESPSIDSEEPSFVTYGRRRQRISRIMRILTGFGSFVLLLCLIAQSAYTFRIQIAARLPQLKPALVQACASIGCSVSLPAQVDAVKIESDGPQPLAPNKNVFEFTALLRNYSQSAQAWPHIELILKDANGKMVVRRVFTPSDYVVSQEDIVKGIPAASEQPVKLFFELAQLKAARFEVDRFYP